MYGKPSIQALTAVLAPCHARNQSINDTAVAVRELFAASGKVPEALQLLLKEALVMPLHRCFNQWQSVDTTGADIFELFAAADQLSGNQVTMTGHQLKRALELTWPPQEHDPDRGFTVVTISRQPAGPSHNEDGASVDMPAGLYLSFDDIPEEGMQHLPEERDPRVDSAG